MFGYSGGAILPVYDAVFRYNALHARADGREPLPLVVPANEQGAGFMAAGAARLGQGWRGNRHLGARCHQHRHAGVTVIRVMR